MEYTVFFDVEPDPTLACAKPVSYTHLFLSYEREAYYFKTDKQIRITFDTNIKYQTENVSLLPSISGIKLLSNNLVLMELKAPFSIPYDLAKYLSSEKIFKTPFSKYGTAYKQIHKLS